MAVDQQSGLTLWDYLLVLARQWAIIALSLLLALGWAVYTFRAPEPLYRTSTTIRVSAPTSRDALFKDVTNVLGQERTLDAQVKYLTSLEFHQLVAERVIVDQLSAARQKGASAVWPGFDQDLHAAAQHIQRNLTVEKDDGSQTLELSFFGSSIEQVETLARIVPEMFSKTNKSRVNQKYNKIRNFIRRKVDDFQERERELTQSVWMLRGNANAFNLGEDALQQTEKMLADTHLKREIVSANLTEYRERIDRVRGEQVTSPDTTDELIKRLSDKMVELEYQKSLLMRDYTTAHPKVQEISEELALTRDMLNEKIRELVGRGPESIGAFDWYRMQVEDALKLEIEMASLERQELALEQMLDSSVQEARAVATFQQELARLDSEMAHFRALRQDFHDRLVELDLSIEMDREEGGYAEVLDRTVRAPQLVVASNVVRHFSTWTIFGLLVGIVFAFFLDYNDTSIKTEQDVRRWLGLPILSSIPLLREIKKRPFKDVLPEFEMGRQTMEAFRTLRTQVEFKGIEKPLKTLLVTSTRPSEGKTAVISNLAVTFAQKGERVLLVDCDLRRPALHRHMELERSPGLSNVLVGEMDWKEAIQETDMPNLWVLSAGDMTVNPSEILGSAEMRTLMEALSKSYDRVLFDMSSVLAVTDSAILGSQVDGVLLVVKAYKTPRHYVQQAIEVMHNVDSKFIGVVFNQVRRYGSAYYYYYYYHSDSADRITRR